MGRAAPPARRGGRVALTMVISACLLFALQLLALPALVGRRSRLAPAGIVSDWRDAGSDASNTSEPPGSFEAVVAGLPAPPHTVVLTFGTVAVLDFLLNWVAHVQRLPEMEPFVVAALDKAVYEAAAAHGGVRVFLAPHWRIIADRAFTAERQHKGASEYFRADLSAFKKMGHVKALTIAALLDRGYSSLVSDVDVVWLRHPWGALHAPGKLGHAPEDAGLRASLAEADLLLGTDAVDFGLERAAHRLLEAELNTGVLFARAAPSTLAFVREWAFRCLHTRDGHDQQELNHLLKGCYPHEGRGAGAPGPRDPADRDLGRCSAAPYAPTLVLAAGLGVPESVPRVRVGGSTFVRWAPPAAHEGDAGGDDGAAVRAPLGAARLDASLRQLASGGVRPVQWLWHGRLRAAVLPMALFLGGHTYFVQHVHERPAAPRPVAVHLSWGFGDLYGKRERLREQGWWLVEPPAYFEAGHFLRLAEAGAVYERAVEPFRAAAQRCSPEEAASGRPAADCWHPANLVSADPALGARDPRAALDPAAPQLAAQAALRRVLRNAFALAEATGRVLVLPELRCYCERFWWLLEDCRVAGAQSMALPFVCPFDFVFEPFWWDALNVSRRHASFWDDPRVPRSLLASTARLELGGARGGAGAHVLRLSAAKSVADVARGLSEAPAVLSGARVLEVDAAELGALDGCAPAADVRSLASLNERLGKLLGGHSVEYCSRERNPFLAEEAPTYTSRGRDAKEALNCSYPGADPVVANPVTWASRISDDNRRRWYGGDLRACAG